LAPSLVVRGLASIGALWLGFTMVCAVATHVFILHTGPVPAIVLGLLNALVVYLRRNELVALTPGAAIGTLPGPGKRP
jgi:putative oxidoreductase